MSGEKFAACTSAIVLCGGRSSRMGRDKAVLPFGSGTLLSRTVEVVRACADDVVLVSPAVRAMPGTRAVRDPGEGPLVALLAGLGAVRAPRALVLACDMPLVRPALLNRLDELIGSHAACVPRVHGIPMPTCAVYARTALDVAAALAARGERSLKALLDRLLVRWVEEDELRDVDPDLDSFLDCDTPEDYRRALTRAGLNDERSDERSADTSD